MGAAAGRLPPGARQHDVISHAQAQAIAESHISQFASSEGSFAILETATIERPHYWVFFYQSKRYLESGNPIHALAGNAPLIVDRSGQVTETGTAYPLEDYLSDYEAAQGTGAT